MRNKRSITHEEMKDPVIIRSFLKAFNERTIDAGYLSKNKTIKTNCITSKPKRGKRREFIDRYLKFTIPDPYIKGDYLSCQVHRVAAFLFIGLLVEGLFALHICDIKMCCNPDHLYIGTFDDNRTDFVNRRGEQRPDACLTRYEWESINYWKDRGEHTIDELSNYFGVTTFTIFTGGDNFTTDGSEVIGPVFVPRIIPEAVKVTRIKQDIEIGNELLSIRKFCRQYSWNFDWELDNKIENLGIGRSTAYKKMRLAQANPHRLNYKYGYTMLMKMIVQGIDVSVPI